MNTLGEIKSRGNKMDAAHGGAGGLKGVAEGRIESFGIRARPYFSYVHVLMLLALVVVIVVPAIMPLPADEATVRSDFTLATNFLVWGLWFPLLYVSVVFFGRLWCGVLCPQGALAEYLSRYSLGRPVPGWMRWGGVPLLSFIVITIAGQVLGIRDYPLPAMAVFVGTTLVAVIVGLLYTKNRRVWCRYMCPVGPLLGVLSRLGAVGFENDTRILAATEACPTFIKTSQKSSASHCIECFKCTTGVEAAGVAASTNTGLRLRLRVPGSEIEEMAVRGGQRVQKTVAGRGPKRETDRWEVLFIFVATGLALSTFHWLSNPLYTDLKNFVGLVMINAGFGDVIGRSGPWWTMVNYPASGEVFNVLDVVTITAFMVAAMVTVAAALFVLTSISALLIRKGGAGVESFGETVTRLGYQYAPVALVSLVLGLGLVLFDSLGIFGLGQGAIRAAEVGVFMFGAVWSAWLAVKLHAGAGRYAAAALIPSLAGICIIAALWHMVLF